MGWISAAVAVMRDAFRAPAPLSFTAQPATRFAVGDTAPMPVDRLIARMRAGSGPVTRDDAMTVAAVQRGRNELCSIATFPLQLYSGGNVIASALLRQFDPDVPNVVHMAATIEDLALSKIAWWEVTAQDYDRFPVCVRRLDPACVTVNDPGTGKPDPLGRQVWIDRGDGRSFQPYPSALMIRFDSPNPGILAANARAVRIAMRLDALVEMYAENPALREYFTDSDSPEIPSMQDDEIDSFLAEFGAMRQLYPYGWIPGSVKRADVSTPSPRDLTLVDLRREVGIALANGLGVDPEDIGISTTSRTYQNEDARRRDKLQRMYGPYMRAITDRLTMGDVTRYGHTVNFDLTEYLRADPLTRIAYYQGIAPLVGGIDPQWIATQEGIPVSVTGTGTAAAGGNVAAAAATAAATRSALRFADRPAHVFAASDFGGSPPAPTVDTQSRTITGLAVPYGVVGNKYGLKYQFAPGSLEYGDPARLPHLKDHYTPVGFHRSITDSDAGPVVELAVLDGPDGSPAKADRDQLLYDAEHGLYTGLSIGVDFSPDPADGDVEYDQDTDVYRIVRATWRETSTTYMPVFDDARVTGVASSHAAGGRPMHCQHCGQPHGPGIACATYAAQLAGQQATPAGNNLPVRVGDGFAAGGLLDQMFTAYTAQLAEQQATAEPAPGPILVNPAAAGMSMSVSEPAPYRFDRHGNLRAGSHDFSSDLLQGWRPGGGGDLAARDRAETFVRAAFEGGDPGRHEPLTAAERFAVTPGNVTGLNPPRNRPDLYVDQLDYQYPMYTEFLKGTLDDITPFVVPKFASAAGLVADHVTGVEPTPGTFTATAQTITPSPLSGKVEITREAFDQGGNPQMSGLIWRQMTRAWYEGLEAYVQAQLVAVSASIPDITIAVASVDAALDTALANAIVPLQYIRGGDRFRKVFTQIDLYKAMVNAHDTTGRRLYPSVGAVNAGGTADPRYGWLDAHGKLWVPAWATAASGIAPASSWMLDSDVACLWASAPQRLDLEWRVAWVDLGIWGYKAWAVTDYTRTRELIYDPAAP